MGKSRVDEQRLQQRLHCHRVCAAENVEQLAHDRQQHPWRLQAIPGYLSVTHLNPNLLLDVFQG